MQVLFETLSYMVNIQWFQVYKEGITQNYYKPKSNLPDNFPLYIFHKQFHQNPFRGCWEKNLQIDKHKLTIMDLFYALHTKNDQ